MWEKVKILTWCCLIFFGGTGIGFACECEPLDLTSQIDSADVVFEGTVIYVNTNWMSGGMKYSFQVHRSWKRRVDTVMVINSGFTNSDCGYNFKQGERYLVFARKKFSFKTDRCAGNRPIDEATNIITQLGPGQRPAQSSLVPIMYWTLSGLTIGALIFMAIVVLRKRKPNSSIR